jgi:ubiquinone/menaquinone biosynthesis C-methylase UbiE
MEIKNFWESCDENFSHISLSRHLPGYEKLTESWENNFISKLDFKDTTVIDYGIGGGYLGKYLLSKKECKKYIGVDISQRSLSSSKKNLSNFNNNVTLIDTSFFYSSFNEKSDIFISQACIQHFPNEEYLINFLNKINCILPNTVMLQIRYSNITKFNSNYKTEDDVCYACQTNSEYISKYLDNYSLNYKSDILNKSKYQFLIYKKNKIK